MLEYYLKTWYIWVASQAAEPLKTDSLVPSVPAKIENFVNASKKLFAP